VPATPDARIKSIKERIRLIVSAPAMEPSLVSQNFSFHIPNGFAGQEFFAAGIARPPGRQWPAELLLPRTSPTILPGKERIVLYVEVDSLDAATHFAVEQYCMERLAGGEPLALLWRTLPCVMLGRNQVVEAEVDPQAAQRLGVRIVRRPTGGGAIYTDEGTFQCTNNVPYSRGDVRLLLRAALAGPLQAALRDMGVPAEIQGRNDLLAGGRKIAGLAQWVWKKHLCSHASLLYRADLSALGRILRVDEEKIASKAVTSVRSRVANISESLEDPPATEIFREQLRDKFLGDAPAVHRPTDAELARIRALRDEKYGADSWTYGAAPPFDRRFSRRFAGGKVEVALGIVKGRIASCGIHGDFLAVRPVRELELRLEGAPYNLRAVRELLADVDVEPYLGTISREQFLECLFA
jgi:lipoate-protein ligase A